MAKLKRNFLRGRMNKDLDERLVPNGEYRDAVNVQVSTSEGSDVGAIENILGNTKKSKKSSAPIVFWDANFGLNNTKCIGAVRDGQNNKIYWFITSDTVDAILEYDQATDLVAPILIDANNVLNLNSSYLITGVNILEGLLYWTDDLNEPKVVNISDFKSATVQNGTALNNHTEIYGRDFIEKDITVITEVPNVVLNVQAAPSLIGGLGTGITPVNPVSFSLSMDAIGVGTTVGVSWVGNPISWTGLIDPSVVITVDIEDEDGSINSYQITGTLSSIGSISALLTVQSMSNAIPNSASGWSMLVIEDDPIFKNDFPRFSYRYKYTDGRYSVYAPFSKPAFVPGKFEYLSRDGNNEGMNSVIRKITLSGFPTRPQNVKEVEVLYKGVSSNNVYVIETFNGPGPFGFPQQVIELQITSGVLGPVVESLQLLRLYDNVPLKAKSQEIVANRLVYGNYLHNYDVTPDTVAVTAGHSKLVHSDPYFGVESVKTDREYQIGISFVDNYGRESPIFTSNSGSVALNREDASAINLLTASLTGVPSWAVGYKYYIKDAAPEYYNIALDRYYDSKDGGVWLSFPSSERNKLKEGEYIILKKQHDFSIPVSVNNKYKILNISNEAPSFITNLPEPLARYNGLTNLAGDFVVGNKQVTFLGPTNATDPVFFSGFQRDNTVQFILASGASSFEYEIYSGGPTAVIVNVNNVDYNVYEVYLKQALREDDAWLASMPLNTAITIAVNEIVTKNLPEFQGRFFTKINPNATFYDSIPKAFESTGADYLLDFYSNVSAAGEVSPFPPELNWFDQYNDNSYGATAPGVGLENGTDFFNLFYSGTPFGFAQYPNSVEAKTWAALQEPGTRIKFVQSNGSISDDFYVVLKVENGVGTYGQVSTYDRDNNFPLGAAGSNGFFGKFTLNRPYTDTGDVNAAGIQVYRERIKTATNLLSSSNPAIFETEPAEQADLDIYWEASGFIPGDGSATTTLNWFNCYSFGNGVESDRIRDDFNAPVIGKGVRVNAELQEPYKQERRAAGLIYSGLYNSISGVNNTNQFTTAVQITKDLDPAYGGIQKLHARDTNLIAFSEDKVFRILADKDALYNADGNVNLTSTNRVLGDASTFAGEFGISKNPESFASYGFRAYFTDKSRGSVLRLSADGITEISEKGMSDYFIDKFKSVTTPLIGSFDEDASSYNLVVGTESVSFKEKVDGWPTRLTYTPEFAVSLNNEYYTFSGGELWEHSSATRSNFYGIQYNSSVSPIFNDSPESIKNFKTLAYSGSKGWKASVVTDLQDGIVENWKKKENLFFNYIKGLESTWDNATQAGTLDLSEFTTQGIGNPPVGGIGVPGATHEIVFSQAINVSAAAGDSLYRVNPANNNVELLGPINSVDGSRLVYTPSISTITSTNDYVFFVKNNIFNTSGLLGYYGETTLTTTLNSKVELFGVSAEVFISSE